MRILVIRRDNIGDLVCTTPLIAALRARYPDAYIAALVNTYNAAVLEGNPCLDATYSYAKLKHRLDGQSLPALLLGRLRTLLRLRRHRFDYVVLAKTGFDRQGLRHARLLKRKEIVGFADPREAASRHITRPVRSEHHDSLHEVETIAQLARAIDAPDANGPLRVYPDPARVDAWRSRLPALQDRRRNWIAVHVSAREPSRRWPEEKWRSLLERLISEGAGIVLVWAPGPSDDPRHPGDDELATRLIGNEARANLLAAPTAGVADLIAVLSLCSGFVGADGGAMHIAAGLDLPMVALFENREDKKRRWHPWRVPYEMVVPATRDIADISVDQVSAALGRLANAIRTRSAL